MKKLILLLLTFVTLSCSTDEGPDDPIIATWTYSMMIQVPLEGDPIETEANECQKKETMTFRSNGKLDAAYYHYNVNSECVINDSATGSYNWVKMGEDSYRIGNELGGTTYKFTFPDASTMWMTNEDPSESSGLESRTYVYSRN